MNTLSGYRLQINFKDVTNTVVTHSLTCEIFENINDFGSVAVKYSTTFTQDARIAKNDYCNFRAVQSLYNIMKGYCKSKGVKIPSQWELSELENKYQSL